MCACSCPFTAHAQKFSISKFKFQCCLVNCITFCLFWHHVFPYPQTRPAATPPACPLSYSTEQLYYDSNISCSPVVCVKVVSLTVFKFFFLL